MRRFFSALDVYKAIDEVSSKCHRCVSVQNAPHLVVEQSTCDPPDVVGMTFIADIIKRARQLILVIENTCDVLVVLGNDIAVSVYHAKC